MYCFSVQFYHGMLYITRFFLLVSLLFHQYNPVLFCCLFHYSLLVNIYSPLCDLSSYFLFHLACFFLLFLSVYYFIVLLFNLLKSSSLLQAHIFCVFHCSVAGSTVVYDPSFGYLTCHKLHVLSAD